MPQILSIQSHVVRGYVGNKAAVFPLQLHGFDVDPINTVSLSNHSGYPVIKGQRLSAEDFKSIISGMRENHFLSEYDYLLTGYINNASIIQQIGALFGELLERREERQQEGKEEKKPFVFLCDPVMGDDGRLYCSNEVEDAYRQLLPFADFLTPNYFEATVLSGIEVKDLESACQAADWFHAQGTKHVIIKSFRDPEDETKLQFLFSVSQEKNKLDGSAAVEKTNHTMTNEKGLKAKPVRYTGKIKRFSGRYTGTGDVFAAVFLAFLHKNSAVDAVALAMGVLQDLIEATFLEGGTAEASLNSRELKVTHAVDSLLSPKTKVHIFPLP